MSATHTEDKLIFCKLGNGAWAIKSPKALVSGDTVTISKKNGGHATVIVDKFHSMLEGGVYGTDFYIYTFTNTDGKKMKKGGNEPKEQTEFSNNKPKHKQTHSEYMGYKTPTKLYNLYIWQDEGNGYKLITELNNIPMSSVNTLASVYAGKPDYLTLGKLVGKYETHLYGPYDIYEPINEVKLSQLYESILAKKEKQDNLDRLWIHCKMNCETFPARSQKIRGIRELTPKVRKTVDMHAIEDALVVSYNDDLDHIMHKHNGTNHRAKLMDIIPSVVGRFMRPCPKSPAHGFIDSRLVKSKEQVLGVIDEIKNYKDGIETPEFIVMNKIDCDYSAVITPDMVGFGESNDGATSGKDAIGLRMQLSESDLEAYRKLFWNNNEAFCSECRTTYPMDKIGEKCDNGCNKTLIQVKWPYVELLYEHSRKNPTIVQLRAGSSQTMPQESIKVKYIVEVSSFEDSPIYYDLAKEVDGRPSWNDKAIDIAKDIENAPDGVNEYSRYAPVVWHPNGLPSSHYGVHCRDHNIPYTISETKPVVGEIVKIGVKSPPNVDAFKEGLILGMETKLNFTSHTDSRAVKYLMNFLGALHGYALMDIGDRNVARFIGYSWAIGARIIAGLPFGEMVEGGKSNGARATVDKVIGLSLANHRDYMKIWSMDIETYISGLIECFKCFNAKGLWGGGYGGPAWAACTLALIEVFVGIRDMIKSANTNNLSKLVDSTNKMVNLAHNNGWWLNKMLTTADFDNAHMLPHFSLSPEVAYRIKDEYKQVMDNIIALKVKGFKVSNKIKVSDELLKEQVEIVKKEPSYVYEYAKPTPKVEVPKLSQEEIGKLQVVEAGTIYAQHTANSSTLHIQIACDSINRPYGYANSYSWLGNDSEVVGKFVELFKANATMPSLTGSQNMYGPILIMKSSKDGFVIYTNSGRLALIHDTMLYSKFEQVVMSQAEKVVA